VIEKTLQSLQQQLEVLQGGDWRGKSATAFYQEMDGQVLPSLKRLTNALTVAQLTTVQINRIMAEAEAEAARWLRGEGAGQSPELGSAFAGVAGPQSAGGTGISGSAAAKANGAAMPSAFVGGSPSPSGGGAATGAAPKTAAPTPDPRAEKVQVLLDQARHEKEMYDDTRRVAQERLAKYREAKRQNKDEREILRLKAEYHAARQAEKFYRADMLAKHNEAIELAVKLYKIDLSAVKGKPQYDWGSGLGGYTDDDRSIEIGNDGFARSPGWLASTIGHEAVHARQMKEGRSYDGDESPQGLAINQYEAYQWELDNAKHNGLTADEVASIKRLQAAEFRQLSKANQERVKRGIYTLAPE
jgi:WXG100 family type VII secretion target